MIAYTYTYMSVIDLLTSHTVQYDVSHNLSPTNKCLQEMSR